MAIKKKHTDLPSFTADQTPRLNKELKDIWDSIDGVHSAIGSGIQWVSVPQYPIDPCTEGQMAKDSTYLYICVATNSWLRTQIYYWSPPGGSGYAGVPIGLLLSLTYNS